MKPTPGKVVKSASRALDVLEHLAAGGASFTELTAALRIPKSSLYHLLANLLERGYVEQTPAGRYKLGPRLAELLNVDGLPRSLAVLMAPIVRELSEDIKETCGFYVQKGDEVETVTTATGQQALMFSMKIGDLAPLYAVSGGKIILARQSSDWLRGYLKRVRFDRFTPSTIQSADRLLQEIERARAESFGYSHEEFTIGIIGIASTVELDGRVAGAINVAMPAARFNDNMAAKVRQSLRRAVAQAEEVLKRSQWQTAKAVPGDPNGQALA